MRWCIMVFICRHSGGERGWRCVYRNLKAGEQGETVAHMGVWLGEQQGKVVLCKHNGLGLKVLGSTMCECIYPSFRGTNGLKM